MEQTINLPEDDTYAILAYSATELTSKPAKNKGSQIKSDEVSTSSKNRADVAAECKRLYGGISMNSDKPDSVIIRGKEYKAVLKDHDENNGFQAIVFKHPDKDAYILAVGGSYPAKKFFSNPKEWINDWCKNNLLTGVGKMPDQFDSLEEFLKLCKKKEINITEAVGFSQGSISLGLALMLNDNSHIKGYLYNGGAPEKLVPALKAKCGKENVNSNPTNFITMISKDEPLSRLLYWVKGAGTYLVTADRPDYAFASGHPIITHFGLKPASYKTVFQNANAVTDSLEVSTGISAYTGWPEFKINFNLPDKKNTANAIATAVYQLAKDQVGEDGIKHLNFKVNNNGVVFDMITDEQLDEMSKKLGVSKEELIKANDFKNFKKGQQGVIQLINENDEIVVPRGDYKGKHTIKQLKKKSMPTGGAAPISKNDEDGHWITTKEGNHVLVEDSRIPWGQNGWPEVYFSIDGHSEEYWEIQNDPALKAYLNGNKINK